MSGHWVRAARHVDAYQCDPSKLQECRKATLRLKELMGQDDLTTVNAARASLAERREPASDQVPRRQV